MTEFESLIAGAQRGDLAGVKTVLDSRPKIINQRDQSGATALHYAALDGHRDVVEELVRRGAEINVADGRFGATPAGWAIEYLREMGGFLGIELEDFGHAIQQGEVQWVARFLRRFPALRGASDKDGRPFKLLAQESGNREIARLLGSEL